MDDAAPAAPLLSFELLEELRESWQRQGAPIASSLAPGLDPREIDDLTQSVGVRLPVEPRTWWAWHDGVPPSQGLQRRQLGPGQEYACLAEAVDWHGTRREIAADLAEHGLDPDEMWPMHLFPILHLGDIACDCSVADHAPSPIFDADYHHTLGPPQVRARSFGEMVEWWIEALNDGAWRYDPERGTWIKHLHLLDPDRERSGLV